MNYPIEAVAVANWFVERGIKTRKPVTPLKLMKLVYFAHGWFLAVGPGKPLINCSIEAWEYGPVASRVYRAFRHFGSDPIDRKAAVYSAGILGRKKTVPNIPKEDGQLTKFLEMIGIFTDACLQGSLLS